MPPTTAPDAVLIAPDGSTAYLASAVEAALAEPETDSVLEVPCTLDIDIDVGLAEWCLSAGSPIGDRFAQWSVDRLLVSDA